MKLTDIIKDCKHTKICTTDKKIKKVYCNRNYQRTCDMAKHYDKYGPDANQLGVGS